MPNGQRMIMYIISYNHDISVRGTSIAVFFKHFRRVYDQGRVIL